MVQKLKKGKIFENKKMEILKKLIFRNFNLLGRFLYQIYLKFRKDFKFEVKNGKFNDF